MKNNWPDNSIIQQYIKGTLDAKTMHQLEEKALEDPFLAEALEGYAQTPEANRGLSILQRQLHDRIAHHQQNKKVFNQNWQRLSIAAAAAVIFISAGVLFWMNSQPKYQKTAGNTQQTEVKLTPKDSLTNSALKDKKVVKTADEDSSELSIKASEPLIASHKTNRLSKKAVISEVSADKQASAVRMGKSTQTAKSGDSLNPDKANSQVMVSDIDTPNAKLPEPADGWLKYKKYIAESVSKIKGTLNASGKVKLDFTVDQQGRLSNFKILKGLTNEANAIAVKIIQNGPLWNPAPSGKEQRVELEVDFLKE